jgi:hypothetical protein
MIAVLELSSDRSEPTYLKAAKPVPIVRQKCKEIAASQPIWLDMVIMVRQNR